VAESRNRIGVDLGGSKIHGVVLQADGRFSRELRVATPKQDYQATLEALVTLVEQLDPTLQMPVGIGTPGSPLPGSGLMHNCNSTWLNGTALSEDLNAALGGRVRIANDADCFALSEAKGGAGDGAASVFGVILGTGVGGGVVIDGRLHRGPSGLSGEWGHNPLPYFPELLPDSVKWRLSARECYCGQLNCIETFLSGPGLAQTHQELWDELLDALQLYRQAAVVSVDPLDCDPDWKQPFGSVDAAGRARLTLSLYCQLLAAALAGLVNILDPAVVVLGGGLSQMHAIYQPLQRQLEQRVFGAHCRTRILPPVFGDASGVRGAAWLWEAD